MKIRRRRSSVSDDGRYWFDADEADRAQAFIERLCCFDDGSPFVLQGWQRDFVRRLFGTKRRDNGCRRYRIVFMSMGRGNGKTPLMAAVGAYLLFTVQGAALYSAAADRDQAAIMVTDVKNFINASPALASRAEILRNSVVIHARGSFWRVLSGRAAGKHGLRPLGVFFDELHEQKGRELWDALYTARGKNPNSLIYAVTTAGYDRKSICYEVYDRARKVRDGVLTDEEFLPVIFEPAQNADWREPSVWSDANPNLDVTVKREFLESECRKAKEQPAFQNTFRRLYLNEWTEQETRAIAMEDWSRCEGAPHDLAALSGRACWAAIDLSSKLDVTSCALVFPPEEDNGTFELLTLHWIPRDNIEARIRRDGVPFDAWIRDKWVEATEGNIIDYAYIRKRLNELREVFDIREVVFDPWNAAQISIQLQEDGFNVTDYPNTYSKLSEPTQNFLALVSAGRLHHGGNPPLTWMASNLVIRTNVDGLSKPAKNKSADRIDGIVATIMALARAVTDTDAVPQIFPAEIA